MTPCPASTCDVSSSVADIVNDIRDKVDGDKRIVFVWGNFNVVHPGHLRLLNFASECADFLVVAVMDDSVPGVYIPHDLRMEGVRAISAVDYSFLLRVPPEDFIEKLMPDIVVKGKEHEQHFNPELAVIEAYGGKLLFSSGDVRFSSMDLLRRELSEIDLSDIRKPLDFPKRHGFDFKKLVDIVHQFSRLRIVVLGDLIVDEYITCDPLGMSQEDPTIVVTPLQHDLFIGGGGIVAAHAQGLGASVDYFGVVGNDPTAEFARKTLESFGVRANLIVDDSRPTTLKQRFRARGKTLLRVSHLRQHDIGQDLISTVMGRLLLILDKTDLLVFSDFNYGCLPQALVEEIIGHCQRLGVMMVADSQSSSQIGDVSRFQGMHLITPTEHEARLAVRDTGSGLAVLAASLQEKSKAGSVFITMGSEGVLIHSSDASISNITTDQLPALNSAPKDVSGAGDSLLICASMARAVGASLWESAYLGSIAAACQVGRVGNTPLSAREIVQELSS